jgi:hypothetical protein
VTDDQAMGDQVLSAGSEVSRRRFMQGSAAVVGAAALLRPAPMRRPLSSAVLSAAGFTLSQASGQAHGTGSVTLALPNAASASGTLLVATVVSSAAGTPFTPPAGAGGTGWQLGKAVQCGGGRIEQWYWANNPGGLYAPTSGAVFTGASGVVCRGGIAEFSTPAGSAQVLDTVGQASGTGYGTAMPVTSAAGVFAGTLGVFGEAEFFGASIGNVGASWTDPGGFTHLASLGDVSDDWASSYNGNVAAGYQNPSGGFSYTGPEASAGWAALLCCYRAVMVSPINLCGAEVTNCLALDPTGQQLIVGGDVEGIFRTANFGDNWQPADYGLETQALQSFAFVAWSELEPGVVYAGGGHSAGDGAFLASTDGGATWLKRSQTPIWWYGNATPSPPRPSGTASDQDRSVGRMLAQDAAGGNLYSATASGGVMRSTDKGANWTTVGLSASGYWLRCIVVNPANGSELWVGAWDTGNGLGGVWHYTPTLGWAQLGGYTGTVADLKIIGTGSSAYLYAACDTNGIFRAPVSGGPLVSLNGAGTTHGGTSMNGIDTSGSSLWVSLDAYVDSSGDHQVIAGCSIGVKWPDDANYTNIVRLKLPGGSASGIIYTDLTGPNTITIGTFPPFGTSWWHAKSNWQSWLGGSQNGNPHILIDPGNPQRIYVTGHGGFFRSYDGGHSWQLACNGMEIIAVHAFAIDPNNGSHFVTCGDDYTSYDFTDPAGNSGAAGISDTNPPGSGMESHGAAFDPVDSRVYLAQNQKFGVNSSGGVFYRAPAAPFSWTDTGYGAEVGSIAPMGLYADRDASNARFVLTVALGKGIYRWTGGTAWSRATTTDGSAPGVAGSLSARVPTCPFVADGATAGVVYCFDKPTGLYCSHDYGQTWIQAWPKTTSDQRSGWLAARPGTAGELWVATDAGLFQLTNASGGTVSGGQVKVNPIGGVFSAGAAGIAYAPGGALYAIGLGGASPAPRVTTLYVSHDDGVTWQPWCNGDGSDTSYGSPGGQLGISSSGYLWAVSGIHVGYWDRIPS